MIRSARISIAFILALLSITFEIKAQSNSDEVLTVDSSTVLINATILDGDGRYVSGLRREQFSVFEDGVQQEISFFSTAETPFAAVILIDTSGSMRGQMSMARAAAINFLDGIRRDDQVAIYRFASRVELVQDFSTSRDISESIFDAKADGMTALNDAVFLAAKELAMRPEKRRAIIVLSDGEDSASGRSADRALRASLEAGAVIYTVDLSSIEMNAQRRMQSQGVLRNFANRSGGRFVSTPAGRALRQAFEGILDELRMQYTLAYEPIRREKDGRWRSIEVRVTRPNLTIRTRKGYTP